MSTPNKVLQALAGTGNAITIGIEVAGELVPLVKGLVQEIKAIAEGGKTVSYQVLIQTDTAELDAIDKLSTDDLAAINAELAKLGVAPVPLPPASPTNS